MRTKDKQNIYSQVLKDYNFEESAVALFCIASEGQIKTKRHRFYFQLCLLSSDRQKTFFATILKMFYNLSSWWLLNVQHITST